MMNKISGKRSPAEVKHLQVDDKEITAVADIADTLAESFSEISSNKHYSSKFQSHKAHAERQTLKFNSHNMETYNTPFSTDELLDALSSSNDSAVGLDDIHYQMPLLTAYVSHAGGIILLRTSCLKILAKMRPDRVKMHQNAFGGRALPEPAGGANNAPQTP